MSTNVQAHATTILQSSTNKLSEIEGLDSRLPRSDSTSIDLGQQRAIQSNTSKSPRRSLSAQDDSEAETEILGGSLTTSPLKGVAFSQEDKNHFQMSDNVAGPERATSWEVQWEEREEVSKPYSENKRKRKVVSSDREGVEEPNYEHVVSSSDGLHEAEAGSTQEARLSPDQQIDFDDVSNRQKQGSELCNESGHQQLQIPPIPPPNLTSPYTTTHDNLSGSRSPVHHSARRRSSSFHSSFVVTESKHRLRSYLTATEDSSDIWSDEHLREKNHLKMSNRKTPSTVMPARKDIDKSGRTPLARACADVDIDKVKIHLTQSRGDIDKPDHAGNTPLQIAALDGAADIVNLLLASGCDIHCANDMGDTPLIDAIENGRSSVVKILLDAGVDPQRANNKGNYPKDLVPRYSDDVPIMSLLDDAIAVRATIDSQDGPLTSLNSRATGELSRRSIPRDTDFLYVSPSLDKLLEFAKDGDIAGIDYMLQCGIKPNNACMVLASTGGHVDVMNILLAEGASPDPDPGIVGENNTPMMAAIGRGHPAAVELLLQQSSFDPMRLVGGKRYYQVAAKLRGPLWEQERILLINAYKEKLRRSMHFLLNPST